MITDLLPDGALSPSEYRRVIEAADRAATHHAHILRAAPVGRGPKLAPYCGLKLYALECADRTLVRTMTPAYTFDSDGRVVWVIAHRPHAISRASVTQALAPYDPAHFWAHLRRMAAALNEGRAPAVHPASGPRYARRLIVCPV